MPIFVYRCDCGAPLRADRPRAAEAPACPECGSATRKIPAGPSLARGAAAPPARPTGAGAGRTGDVLPTPWQGVVSGGPEKVKREVEFRQRLEKAAVSGLRTPGGPDRSVPKSGDTSGSASTSAD